MSTGSGREWRVLSLLWVLMLFATAYEIVPASILSVIMADLAIGSAAAGWVVSALVLGMALFAIPSGILLDRVSNRAVIVGATAMLLFASAWGFRAGTADAYWPLLASRFLGGIAVVVLWTASVNTVGHSFPVGRRATAIGFLATSTPAGFALGQFTGPLITAAAGWPTTLPAFGILAAVVAAVFWVMSGDQEAVIDATAAPSPADLGRVFTNRSVWIVAVLGFGAFSLNLFFNSWMPTYLIERFGVSLARSGVFAALFPAVGIVARGSSGPVSAWLFDHRRQPVVRLSFLAVIPLVVAIALFDVLVPLLVALVLAGFFVQLGQALLFTYVRELVGANVVATALAVLNAVGLAGAFSAPVITGGLIDYTGSYLHAFGYVALLSVGGTALAWFAPEPRER